jgi:hypothetical protein
MYVNRKVFFGDGLLTPKHAGILAARGKYEQ